MNEKELTHISLFSGIGGFDIAGEWAGFRTVVFCEKEEFCQKVLQKHWPETPIIPEIRDFDGTKWQGATLLTGGFPCQPFSVAGPKTGKEDDRYLWPQMLRVIKEAKPRWVLAENVPGIFHMALDTVLSDLESEGYATGTLIIPACGLNAPHRRNRVWIIAYNSKPIRPRQKNKISTKGDSIIGTNSYAPDSERKGYVRRGSQGNSNEERLAQNQQTGKKTWGTTSRCNKNSSDPNQSGFQVGEMFGQNIRQESPPIIRDAWQEDWYEVATRFCRVDDGVSDRIHRLKALGNAIVPQIAYEILKRIAWIEKNEKEPKSS